MKPKSRRKSKGQAQSRPWVRKLEKKLLKSQVLGLEELKKRVDELQVRVSNLESQMVQQRAKDSSQQKIV